MSDRTSELEAQIAELASSVRKLEQRIAALERSASVPAAVRRAARGRPETTPEMRAQAAALSTTASLGGRTLLVFAGAFVLRALTDSATIPAWLGVALGLAYAGTWVGMADRAARAGASPSAAFHGIAAAIIGFPLLFEATSRFRLLTPAAATAALAVFTAGTLLVAARRRLHGLAWVASVGGVATALAVAAATGRIAPAALVLILLGVATLWLGYVVDWFALRWPIALCADAVALTLALGARSSSPDSAAAALLVQAVLVAAYLGSIAARTLVLGRGVVPFEVAQGVAVVAIGLGGAARVAARAGIGAAWVGAVSIVFGAVAYGVAFAFVERRGQVRANFLFYSSAAIVFVVAGSWLVLPGRALPFAWAALALLAGALARSRGRLTLAAHASVYASAAAIAAGLVGGGFQSLFAPSGAVSPLSAGALIVLGAAGATASVAAPAPPRSRPRERVAQAILVAVVALAAAGAAIGAIAAVAPSLASDRAAIATARTAVLAAAALALAIVGRSGAWVEASWLAYPVLGLAGLKMLLEDLPRGRPASLFISFAACGAALLAIPRLRRRPPSSASAAGASGT